MEREAEGWWDSLMELGISAGADLAAAIVILVAGYMLADWAQRATRRVLDQSPRLDDTFKPFIANVVRYAILIFVVIAVLGRFGVQTASIIAALGVAGLAIGLALQGTLSNLAAGLMLLFLRPFRIGEFIDAGGIAGSVEEIGLFATRLRTADGIFIHVPNSTLLNGSIRNFSRNPTRRVDIAVGVAYGDDTDKALEVALATLKGESRILNDPAPQAMVSALDDSAVIISLRGWVQAGDYWPVLFDLNRNIKRAIETAGLTIPFPQRDVHLIGPKDG